MIASGKMFYEERYFVEYCFIYYLCYNKLRFNMYVEKIRLDFLG